MKPAQVLDTQAELVARFQTESFVNYVAHAMNADLLGTSTDIEPSEKIRAIAEAVGQQVERADAYRVTEDMSALVQYAASRLDSSDKIDYDQPPTPWGIVRFEKPLPIRDVRGETMLGHWMTWGPVFIETRSPITGHDQTRRALLVTWWNDAFDEPDDVYVRMRHDAQFTAFVRRAVGRWAWIGSDVLREGFSLGPETKVADPEIREALIAEGVEDPQAWTNTKRYAHALWLLLGQEVTSVSEEPVPRAAAKRIGRASIPGRVSVVTLRRKSGHRAPGETLVQWTHRWLVRGHWRWQRYGHGLTEQRRIWIHPQIRGPLDKPIAVTRHVYDLRR